MRLVRNSDEVRQAGSRDEPSCQGEAMTSYLSAIWRCRYFWMSLVRMDLRTRYRRSVLGLGWSLLNPIAMTAVLCIVFHKIFGQSIRDFAPYLFAGLATWNYLVTTALQGCQCFFQGESYIRQYPAPLAIYPLRTALGGIIHFLLALSVTLALTWYCKGFRSQGVSLLSLFPTLVLLFFFAWSVAVLTGFANVHFQDTQHLSEVGFQILFYATPVMYKAELLGNGILSQLLKYNPFLYIIEVIRVPIVEGHFPDLRTYCLACLIVLATMLAASFTLSRLQRRLIFHL
jgi:lipopolysaccharide transport system permease protein